MVKATFNKEAFLTGNKQAKESSFPDIKTGVYVCQLMKAKHTTSNAGNYCANFGYQISADDEEFPNQYIWKSFILQNAANEVQENGYKYLAMDLGILGYDENIHGDFSEEFYEKLVGIVVRIQYTQGTEDKPFPKIYLKDVISGVAVKNLLK